MRADGVRCDDGVIVKSSRVDVVGDLGLRQKAEVAVHLRYGVQGSDEPFATPASNVPCTEAKALVLLWIRIERWCRGGHSTHRRKSTEDAVEKIFQQQLSRLGPSCSLFAQKNEFQMRNPLSLPLSMKEKDSWARKTKPVVRQPRGIGQSVEAAPGATRRAEAGGVVMSVTEGMGSLPQQDTNPSAEAFVPRRLHPTMELL